MTPNPPPAGPTAKLVREEGPLATGERFRPLAFAAITALLLVLCAYLTLPFLPAVTWAVALAIVALPLHAWVGRHVPGAAVAAALSTLAVAAVLVGVGWFVTYQLAREAMDAAEQLKERQAEGQVREVLTRTPGLTGVAAWADRVGLDLDAEVRAAVSGYAGRASGLVRGSLDFAVQALLGAFVLFFLFRDRAALAEGVRRLLPMTRPETDRVFRHTADSVYANLYANLVTSAIDGVVGGLVFWAAGVPSPVLWAVVVFVLSILPVVGSALVWVPAAVYLGSAGSWGGAAAVAGWGVASGVLVDNLLYVRLAGGLMRLHQVPTMIAFLGGLAVFGPSGMVLGPAILAATVAVLDVWHRRAAGGPARAADAAPGPGAVAVPSPS